MSIKPQPTAENQWTTSPEAAPADAIAKICRLLECVTYCSLSTCSTDGQPWVSPLFFAYDLQLNVYWSSAIASIHSQNLYTNDGKAVIALYQSKKSDASPDGLYLQGLAKELDAAGVQQALPFIQKRSGRPTERTVADYTDESVRRMYCFVPHQIWCTGDRILHGDQLVDTKISIDIEAIKNRLSNGEN